MKREKTRKELAHLSKGRRPVLVKGGANEIRLSRVVTKSKGCKSKS